MAGCRCWQGCCHGERMLLFLEALHTLQLLRASKATVLSP